MAVHLADFLRTRDLDEDVGDDMSEEYEDEQGKGEKLRHDIFNDNYVEIELDKSVKEPGVEEDQSWVLPPLFKKSAQGHTIKWQMGYNAITKKLLTTVSRLETEGLQLFQMDVKPTRAQKGNYAAKAYQQALTKYDIKIRDGFFLETVGKTELPIPLPALAHKYVPPSEGKAGNVTDFPIIAQPKFDGERLMAAISDAKGSSDGVILMTRHMKPRKYFDHIRTEAKMLLAFLPPGTVLDGEMYSDQLPFQLTASIAGQQLQAHPREKDLDYYLFDIYHPATIWKRDIPREMLRQHTGQGDADAGYFTASGYTVENYSPEAKEYYEVPPEPQEGVTCYGFDEILKDNPLWVVEVRQSLLMNAFRCFRINYGRWPVHLKMVKSYILRSREEIPALFKQIRAVKLVKDLTLEGIMLRHMSRGDADPAKSLYRPDRSNNLLKVKDMKTTEVIIIGVTSGRGKFKDLAVLRYREPGTNITGTTVPPGNFEDRRAMLLNPDTVVGRTLTVSFQDRTDKGALRFPIGQAFVD